MKPAMIISWRYVLWCFGELKEDEWILIRDFSSLFNVVSMDSLYHHFRRLQSFNFIQSKDTILIEGNHFGKRFKLYQITNAGRKKVDYWKETGKGFSKEVKCPRCGFCIN